MDENLNYELLARYLAGECSDEEVEEFESRMKEDPEQELIFMELKRIWDAKTVRPRPWDVENSWDQLSQEMNREGFVTKNEIHRKRRSNPGFRRFQKNWILRLAALFLITGLTALVALIYFHDHQKAEEVVIQEVATERGQRAQIRLEDGSSVRLNVDSKVTYPGEFGSNERIIHLSGEAYFEVVHDERPFLVYADNAVIQILGTEFNVQAYDGDEEIQVVVADGRVNVSYTDAADEEAALLEKGDMASLQRNGMLTVAHDVNLQRHLGWLERRLLFEETPMDEVTKKLERWYGVNIRFTDIHLTQLRLTATFEDEPLREVLRVIQLALDLDYDIEGSEVTFSSVLDGGTG